MVNYRIWARVRDAFITIIIILLLAVILLLPFINSSLAVYITIIAVGMSLALQKYLASFVGHFVIRGSGIFDIGDRIRMGTIKGDVKHIGLFHIILDEVGDGDKMGGELTGKILSVPNLIVLDQPVQNYSRDFSTEDELITCGYVFDEIRIPLKPKSDVNKAVAILEELLWVENSAFIKDAMKIFSKGLPNFLHDIEKGPNVAVHFDEERIWITGRLITPIREKNRLRTKIALQFISRIKEDNTIDIN